MMRTRIRISDQDLHYTGFREIEGIAKAFVSQDINELRSFCNEYFNNKKEQYRDKVDDKEYKKICIPLKEWYEPNRIDIKAVTSPDIRSPLFTQNCGGDNPIISIKVDHIVRCENGYYAVRMPNTDGYIGLTIDGRQRPMTLEENIIHELLHSIGEYEEDEQNESIKLPNWDGGTFPVCSHNLL
ncbi:MAG: hypothetical protein QMD80_04350, partial [archaeon]|nr:hypothetical protein [archaeon]